MTATLISIRPGNEKPFRPNHPQDRNAFLAMVAAIWAAILGGFGWDIIDHLNKHKATWPLVIHIHAVVFLSWLALLTTQVLLVRSRRVDLHRRLGMLGAGLIPVMIVLALSAAWVMDRHYLGTKDADPSFLSIQLVDVIVFAPLAVAALLLRGDASAHKRLILLATFQIIDAGFARLMGFLFPSLSNTEFWQNYLCVYAGTDILVLVLGAYDLVTRRRLHPAYLAGAAWLLLVELTGNWLYVTPAWKPIALRLLGH
jgi:uncharacterized membrane protein